MTGDWKCPDGTLVIPADAPRDQWLTARKTLVGASDVAKLLDLGNPNYGGSFSLWAEKTGRSVDEPSNFVQRRGQIFEDSIIQLWSEFDATRPDGTLFGVRWRRSGLMRSKMYPHLGATVDRLSICDMDGDEKACLLEVKSQRDMAEWEGDDVPLTYQLQGLAQLMVTGRDHVHYVAMGPYWMVEHRVLRRDSELESVIGEKVEAWWAAHVDADVAPAADGRDLDALRTVHARHDGNVLLIGDGLAPHVHALLGARQDKTEAERVIKDATAAVQQAMGEAGADVLVWGEGEKPVVTWLTGKTVDGATGGWVKANAELCADFMTPGPDVLDVEKLVENRPEVLDGGLRKRRTFTVKS